MQTQVMQEESKQRLNEYQHALTYFTPFQECQLQHICQLLGWKIFTIPQGHSLQLSWNALSTQQLSKLWSMVRDTHIEVLTMDCNNHSQILNNLTNTCFTALKVLSLTANSINNVQALGSLNAPQLVTLILDNNSITRVDAITKMQCPSLRQLSLNRNQVSTCNKLQRMYLPKLTSFEFEQNKCPTLQFYRVESLSIVNIDLAENGAIKLSYRQIRQLKNRIESLQNYRI